jgi:hypothetical protein
MHEKSTVNIGTSEDYELLSRFEVSKNCNNVITRWVEWIEPLTVSARFLFSKLFCG